MQPARFAGSTDELLALRAPHWASGHKGERERLIIVIKRWVLQALWVWVAGGALIV